MDVDKTMKADASAETANENGGVDNSPVTGKEYVGYAAGMAGYQMQNSIMNQYLLIFCTNVLGITALAAGTMTFACKFIDAVTDLFFGTLGDRTHSRWGSYKPWYVVCAIPACVAFIFLFTKPGFTYSGNSCRVDLGVLYLSCIRQHIYHGPADSLRCFYNSSYRKKQRAE